MQNVLKKGVWVQGEGRRKDFRCVGVWACNNELGEEPESKMFKIRGEQVGDKS